VRDSYGWGYGWFAGALNNVLYGVFAVITFAVIVSLVFLLVRFLLIGTKAAQVYIAHNPLPARARKGEVAQSPSGSTSVAPAATAAAATTSSSDIPPADSFSDATETAVLPGSPNGSIAVTKRAPRATKPKSPPEPPAV
jgi:hypothetical protein